MHDDESGVFFLASDSYDGIRTAVTLKETGSTYDVEFHVNSIDLPREGRCSYCENNAENMGPKVGLNRVWSGHRDYKLDSEVALKVAAKIMERVNKRLCKSDFCSGTWHDEVNSLSEEVI